MLGKRKKGVVIQIRSPDNMTTKSMTIHGEDVYTVYGRIQHLYTKLSESDKAEIEHIK